ncbi:WASH complex subunit 2 isoform X2 [Erpetoichthys calabaricus]|uniref:WASH complex subunit 2-like n=1 Tax=Erpetoichthys calabaricus TaxID=27687 RepID=A0A8C4S6L0_ERPCA|nr:WASH complex subunit 2 isoform X2 [Erpetoichthys calabaricus]
MNGPAVPLLNGSAEQNGPEGEHIWERAWSLEEMRKSSSNWSLAADSGLLLFLQDFSQKMLSKTHEIEKQLDGLICDTKATDCCLHSVFNDFLMLSNTQFIENRVYDEEVEEPISKHEVGEKNSDQEKTREQKEAELIPKIQEAVNYGLKVLDVAFEQLDIKAGNSDSEDEECNDKVEPILEPKDLYVDRPLPYLIGSQQFMEQDDVGLGDLSSEEASIGSDRDSVIDSEEEHSDEDLNEQEDEAKSISIQKSSMISDDEEEDSDIFGDSDKDEEDEEEVKKMTGSSSFVDELAARIKDDVQNKEDKDQAETISSVPAAIKKKGKGKKATKKEQLQDSDDNKEMFKAVNVEDEDLSAFGGRDGLFSGGMGLFDDEEGDLFVDTTKQERDEGWTKQMNNADPSFSAFNKIPSGAVSVFPVSVDAKQKDKEKNIEQKAQNTSKQPALSSLFDDDEDDDDFFGRNTQMASASGSKVKQKKEVDLFGAEDDDDGDDEDSDIFKGNVKSTAASAPGQKKNEKNQEDAITGKKPPAGAVSMFGPGTKSLLSSLPKRPPSVSDESEKSEENVPPLEAVKPSSKPADKIVNKGLFSDEEDSQDVFSSNLTDDKKKTKPTSSTQNKTKKTQLSIFDDDNEVDDEEDLFATTATNKSKTATQKSQATKTPAQQTTKSVAASLFSDEEDQWEASSTKNTIPQDNNKENVKAVDSRTSGHPSDNAQKKTNVFDGEDLFESAGSKSKPKPQRVSLLFEDETDHEDENSGSLFGSKPTSSIKGPEKPQVITVQSLPDDGDNEDYLYKDAPPPLEEEVKSKKKNTLSLFDDDDDDEEDTDDQITVKTSDAPVITNIKLSDPGPCTKSTGVFQDEELLFSQKQQMDNDPDIDLFASSAKSLAPEKTMAKSAETIQPAVAKPPIPVSLVEEEEEDDLFSKAAKTSKPVTNKPGKSVGLFGEEEEEDLFSVVRPKQPLKPPEKKKPASVKEDASSKNDKIASVLEKGAQSSTSEHAKEAELAINPASLLPGAQARLPGPGLSFTPPGAIARVSEHKSTGHVGVSFDVPVQVNTLDNANKNRPKVSGRRRPQTRAARQLSAQLSSEGKDSDYQGIQSHVHDIRTNSSSKVNAHSSYTTEPSLVRGNSDHFEVAQAAFPPLTEQTILPAKSEAAKPNLSKISDDLFESDDLFGSSKILPQSLNSKSSSTKEAVKPIVQASKEKSGQSIFDQGEDLFQPAAKHKSTKKTAAIPFLEDDGDDLFGSGKTSAVKKEPKPPVQVEPITQANIFEDDIFETEAAKPLKKQKEKSLDSNLFDDSIDIFADLTTTKPPEKKAKKKVETKSIFDDDMDDIFSSGNKKTSTKTQTKTKRSPAANEADATGKKAASIFDDPLNALGGI